MLTGRLFAVLTLLILIGFSASAAFAQSTQGGKVPVFEPGFTLDWTGGQIHTDNRGAVPHAVDWNADKKKDLLVGTFYNGTIFFYANYGTNADPAFQNRVALEADGVEISLSHG